MAGNDRSELHKTIWRIANELRGSVDGWDFKQYVLGFLFYRFISENLTNYINTNQKKAGKGNFDYAKIDDKTAEFGRKTTVEEKGFYILPSELFVNVRSKAKTDENLNETLANIFKNIESSALGSPSELDLKGLFDDLDVNSNKLGPTVAQRHERLTTLLVAVGDFSIANYSDNTIDAFGDAYEYLMTMYASSAGKSGGEFFTPQEVSELLAKITIVGKNKVNKVYDPACGSGSLLLQYAKVLGKENVKNGFFGQEINITTYNLCRINMFLHDINYEKFDIGHGDTLADPIHWDDQPFEAIVSNPPYSIEWDGDSNPLMINDQRFSPAGVLAPKSKADLAFTMHILHWLATNGTAAIVEFPGVMYRGGAERKIRKYLLDNNYVDCVILLPPDLFFGTGIQTCILVLKKSRKTSDVLFINAENSFGREGTKNTLRPQDIQAILDTYSDPKSKEHFSKIVSYEEIKANKFSLKVTLYVPPMDSTEIIDIEAIGSQLNDSVETLINLREEISKVLTSLNDSRFTQQLSDTSKIKTYTLSKLGDIHSGLRGKKKSHFVDGNAKFVSYVNVSNNSKLPKAIDNYVKVNENERQTKVQKGDIIFTGSSETLEDVGLTSVVCETPEEDTYLNSFCFILRPKAEIELLPSYAKYLFRSKLIRDKIIKCANGVTRYNLSKESLLETEIQVPDIDIQEKIAQKLEELEGLTEQIRSLLPVELAVRAKQFSYYRDKITQFEVASDDNQ